MLGIVSLVPEAWGPIWQTRHHILRGISKDFRVIWVNPHRPIKDVLNTFPKQLTYNRYDQVEENLTIFTPASWLPKIYRCEAIKNLIKKTIIERAVKRLEAQGCDRFVLYIWRPEFSWALNIFDWDSVIYHVDDEYSFSENEVPTSDLEKHIIKSADLVIFHSRAIFEKKGRLNPNSCYISNGVDYKSYASAYGVPADMASIKRPIAGYSGFLKNQLDWKLIAHLADKFPNVSFTFVGGKRKQPGLDMITTDLGQRENVYFLGQKNAVHLPSYVSNFDICLMPYIKNSYTKYIYPLKMHEYLATGKPVLSTNLPFVEGLKSCIHAADSVADWESYFISLNERKVADEQIRELRKHTAKLNDWSTKSKQITGLIEETIIPLIDKRITMAYRERSLDSSRTLSFR